ncbi:MAG: hypothetical protein AAF514_19790 [Verrucomicrobiota bacterium]
MSGFWNAVRVSGIRRAFCYGAAVAALLAITLVAIAAGYQAGLRVGEDAEVGLPPVGTGLEGGHADGTMEGGDESRPIRTRGELKTLAGRLRSILDRGMKLELTNDPNLPRFQVEFETLIEDVRLEEIPDLLAMVQGSYSKNDVFIESLLAQRMARLAPEIALEWSLSQQSKFSLHQARRYPFQTIFQEFARRDPEEALALAVGQEFDLGRFYSDAISGVFSVWQKEDVPAAFDAFLQLENDEAIRAAKTSFRSGIRKEESRGFFLDRIEALPDTRIRTDLTGFAVSEIARTDEKAAMAWLDSLSLNGEERFDGMSRIADSWRDRDGGEAMDWLFSQTDPSKSHEILCEMAMNWSRSDRAAWEVWMRDAGYTDRQMNAYLKLIRNGRNWAPEHYIPPANPPGKVEP